MSSPQSIEVTDAFAIEGLDGEALSSVEQQIESIICDGEGRPKSDADADVVISSPTLALAAPPPPRPSRTAEIVQAVDAAADQTGDGDGKVSRTDLVKILEGFVGLIKSSEEGAINLPANAAGTQLSFQPPSTGISTVVLEEKNQEINELKSLLVEAQSTIITLLTDRVDDRARIANLETQLSLIPDLQMQADRALSAAMHTDGLKEELDRVKLEINRVRGTVVRNEVSNNKRSWTDSVRCWLFRQETNKLR
ncbi:MAG TPA: hypothetical protein V6C72_19005 [Chroococcales cyanobacterium]